LMNKSFFNNFFVQFFTRFFLIFFSVQLHAELPGGELPFPAAQSANANAKNLTSNPHRPQYL